MQARYKVTGRSQQQQSSYLSFFYIPFSIKWKEEMSGFFSPSHLAPSIPC